MILYEEKELYQDEIDNAIEETKKQYKNAKFKGIKVDEYYGVFRVPTSILIDEIKRLSKDDGKKKAKFDSDVYMVEKCLVYPSFDKFKELMNEFPGIQSNVVSQIMSFLKFTAEIEVENL